jgi:hypothetical protein
MRFGAHVLLAFAAAGVIAACGGGSTENQTGTLRLSLTDAPGCGGYDHAWVTVEKVRVHRSSTASDSDSGWSEVALAAPTRVDLLTLTNGTLLPLGQTELPAGTYTQMRLVLSDNAGTNPPANAVQLHETGRVVALTTPSGQQSGLKMNVNMEVPPGQVADFAIDFDACKSLVKAGNSQKILLKPVLAVIPILSAAGQRVVGFVHPLLIGPDTNVSVQIDGAPVRATPPDENGQFTLYPVPVGTYDLVITAPGHVNAVMTGVPAVADSTTVIGSVAARFSPPASADNFAAFGTVKVGTSFEDTGGVVRALQSYTGGTTIEAGVANADSTTGAYSMTLPARAPVTVPYAPNLTTITFAADDPRAGLYTLEATVPSETPKTEDIDLTADVETDFVFP